MKCKICGNEYKKMGRHLKSKHGISTKEYYDRFLKQEGDGVCVVCGSPTKFYRLSNGGYPTHCLSCVSRDPLIKRQKEKTCFLNYDSKNPMKNESVKEKYKKNNLKKYGIEWPMEREEVRNKSIHTCMERYGVENINQLSSIQLKKEKTNWKNRGVKYPTQSKMVIEKSRLTCQLRYGTDHYFQTIEGRQLARESFVRSIEIQKLCGEPLTPRIGYLERSCLNELQKYTTFKIIRNPKLIGYFPDGYIEELKLVIEFDERHHFTDDYCTYRDSDIQKDKDYFDMDLKIFRIKQKDWEQNKNKIIDSFLLLIGEEHGRKEN